MPTPLIDLDTGVSLGILVAFGALIAQLWLRVSKLEDKVSTLEAEKSAALDKLTAAASFINRVGLYIAGGMRGPLPEPPEQILPHIDAGFWEQDSPGGTD